MPDDKFLTESEFKKILLAHLNLYVDMLVTIGTLNYALAEVEVLPSKERMKEVREIVEQHPSTVKLRKSLAETPHSKSIDDILRAFEGPIQ